MLRTYLRQIHENVAHIALSLLIAKEHLLGLYTGAGFTCVGLSSVVHGKGVWRASRRRWRQRLCGDGGNMLPPPVS